MNGRSKDLERVRIVVASRLTSVYKTWTVRRELVEGPGTLAVRVEDLHQIGNNHVDIGFILNRDQPHAPILWDCVAGLGATTSEALDRAVETWAQSTLPVFLELLTRDGSYADHYHGDDPEGCAGWHVIHGPVLAFGTGGAPDGLQTWALQNPLLPIIGPLAAARFSSEWLNCVKVLFGFGGEEIAEVRVNSQCDEDASAALKSLDWPRSHESAFARLFFLFVHPDKG